MNIKTHLRMSALSALVLAIAFAINVATAIREQSLLFLFLAGICAAAAFKIVREYTILKRVDQFKS